MAKRKRRRATAMDDRRQLAMFGPPPEERCWQAARDIEGSPGGAGVSAPPVRDRSLSLTGKLRRLTFLAALAFGHPTPSTWIVGVTLFLLGVLVHIWTCGYLLRDAALIRSGPYRFVRHPLYLSHALLDLGFCVIGNEVFVLLGFLILYSWSYGSRMDGEEVYLTRLYPEAYPGYAQAIGRVVPGPWIAPSGGQRFVWRNFYLNSLAGTRLGAFVAYGGALALWFHIGDPRRILVARWDAKSWASAAVIMTGIVAAWIVRLVFRASIRKASSPVPAPPRAV